MYTLPHLDVPPLACAGGPVALPGSKSISNRALLLAALCEGTTRLDGLLVSDDTQVMLDALRTLGCGVERHGDHVRITGLAGAGAAVRDAKLFLGNAGTAMRPLAATLALRGIACELRGNARMHERPIGDLVDALRRVGCAIEYTGGEGFPPLRIAAAPLRLGEPLQVRGDVSSQFLSSLLLALPQGHPQPVRIEVVGELISKPYVEITLALMARFGVAVEREGWTRFTIPAHATYRSPGALRIEPDASSATYFIALGSMAARCAGRSAIEIQGLDESSVQGDVRFVEAARAMGARIDITDGVLRAERGAWPLKAIDLDCNHIPDAAMTLAVMALFADGPSTLRNIASWRVKETDRLAAMAKELARFGARVEEGADFLRIEPPKQWTAATVATYDDHRMAMCFALAALNPAGLPVRIEDPKCVGKTFPQFFETLFAAAQARPEDVPVICIDGPTASGKGTLAAAVAERLGWHYLDSGALYRLAGLAARRLSLPLEASQEAAIGALSAKLPVAFSGGKVLLDGADVTEAIRSEEAGMDASKVSALPPVRAGLLALQHDFRKLPGLVADGRDMGTVVFPTAPLKVYLTASAAQRADRRHKQLILKGISANIDTLRADLEARDRRDSSRSVAPLKPAAEALLLDNSSLSIEQSVQQVLRWWEERQPFVQAGG